MARVHSRDTFISLGGTDLSTFCNTSEFTQGLDEHDVTCYGADDHVFDGGLGSGTFTMGGFYDDGAAGPAAVIEAIRDAKAVVTLIRRPEGTGSGKPQQSVSVLVTSYVETEPVADFITWSCDMTLSDSITRTTQA